jgi:ribose 5-phosphate isomerase B
MARAGVRDKQGNRGPKLAKAFHVMDCAGRAKRRRRFRAHAERGNFKPASCGPKRCRAALATAVQDGVSTQQQPKRKLVALRAGRFFTGITGMKIAIASDHAGFAYKEGIKLLLKQRGHEVRDFGTTSEMPVDYPVFIRPAAEAVANGECERGIVLGGSGNGEAIAADKVAQWARQHNDANMLSIGQRTIDEATALRIVELWLDTAFEGGRHARRITLIEPS